MGIILQIGYVYSPNSLWDAAILGGFPDGKEVILHRERIEGFLLPSHQPTFMDSVICIPTHTALISGHLGPPSLSNENLGELDDLSNAVEDPLLLQNIRQRDLSQRIQH